MIIQHRRGETSDWEKADRLAEQLEYIDVILKDGELAIEICEDGLRRVKIGDGNTKFFDLPYVDAHADTLAAELAQATGNALQRNIDSLKLEQAAHMESTEQAILLKLSNELAAITADYVAADNAAATEISTLQAEFNKDSVAKEASLATLATELTCAKGELTAQIAINAEQLHKVELNIDSLTNTLSTQVDEFSNKLSVHKAEVYDAINASAIELEETFNIGIAEANTALEQVNTRVTAQANELLTTKATIEAKMSTEKSERQQQVMDLKATLEATDEVLTDNIAAVDERASLAISGILADLEALRATIQQLGTSDSSLSDKISAVEVLLAQLAKQLSDLTTSHEADFDSLAKNISDLDSIMKDADATLTNKLLEHVSGIQTELADLVAADSLTFDKITSVETSVANKISAIEADLLIITSKVNSLDMDALESRLENKIDLLGSSINELVADTVDTEQISTSFISEIKQENGKITTSKATLPTASDRIAGITTIGAADGAASFAQAKENAEEIAKLQLAITGSTHFVGITDSALYDGSTINPVYIAGVPYTAVVGDIILCGTKEFIWVEGSWKEFGDLSRVSTLESWRGSVDTELSEMTNSFTSLSSRCLQLNNSDNTLYVGDNADDSIILYCGTADDL